MAGMLRISEAASLGMHAMAMLAEIPDRVLSTRKIAEALKVSEAHLEKVLPKLRRAGLVEAVRGRFGGFVLSGSARQASLLDVYKAVEGDLPKTTCLLGRRRCFRNDCIFDELLKTVDDKVRKCLAGKRLSQLVLGKGAKS